MASSASCRHATAYKKLAQQAASTSKLDDDRVKIKVKDEGKAGKRILCFRTTVVRVRSMDGSPDPCFHYIMYLRKSLNLEAFGAAQQ